MKICPVGTQLFFADGWTDMAQLIVAFRNFVNAPKKAKLYKKKIKSMKGVMSKLKRHKNINR